MTEIRIKSVPTKDIVDHTLDLITKGKRVLIITDQEQERLAFYDEIRERIEQFVKDATELYFETEIQVLMMNVSIIVFRHPNNIPPLYDFYRVLVTEEAFPKFNNALTT